MHNRPLIERASAAIQSAHNACEPADYAEIESVAHVAAAMRAATPAEALLQACILVGEIDRGDPHERAEKLAAALVDHFERAAGIGRRELGFDFYTGSGAH